MLVICSIALFQVGSIAAAAKSKQEQIDAALIEWKDSEEHLAKLTGKLEKLRKVQPRFLFLFLVTSPVLPTSVNGMLGASPRVRAVISPLRPVLHSGFIVCLSHDQPNSRPVRR